MSSLAPLTIRSSMGDYHVRFWDDLDAALEPLLEAKGLLVVLDRKVEALYRPRLVTLLSRTPFLMLDADENSKTLDGVAALASWMQERGANKKTRLVAIGGGIIQDICAFTAHVWYRGIDWIFVPTTLLSMSDSCIGAKSSINHGRAKNQLGAFHSPREVHIVPEFLRTLEDRDIKSGYGEILKLALTEKLADFDHLESALARASGDLLGPELPALIRRSLETKKAVIEKDELETDRRRILNFGHTFGHAIESLSEYEIPHGLAVAWGVDLVNWIAHRKGLVGRPLRDRVHRFIREHLSVPITYFPKADELLRGIRKDKKAEADRVNLILLGDAPFGLKIVPQAYDKDLASWVAEYLTQDQPFTSP
jgi:3-dehydroquinate synthase